MRGRNFLPFLFALPGLFVFGCGQENNERRPPDIIDNNGQNNGANNGTTGTNNGTTGTNNGTTGTNNGGTNNGQACGDDVCPSGRKCVKDVCVLAALKVACEDATDLGMLDVGPPTTASGNTEGFADSLSTECAAMGSNSGAENVVKFQVAQDAVVDLTLTSGAALDWVMEVRTDGCEDGSNALICSDPNSFQFLGRAGTTYFVVVEPSRGIDKGSFDLAVTLSSAGDCTPIGGRTCAAGVVTECFSDGNRDFACATACSGDVCEGDSCAAALEVTASMSFSGQTQAYSDGSNFVGQPTCSTNGTDGLDTGGEDVVLSLPGLTAGQVVTIDASMDGTDSAILVQQTCGDTEACIAANDLGDRLVWTVEADGDYFVVIDRRDEGPEDFSFSIDIQ